MWQGRRRRSVTRFVRGDDARDPFSSFLDSGDRAVRRRRLVAEAPWALCFRCARVVVPDALGFYGSRESSSLAEMKTPNQAASGNSAGASLLHAEARRRAVPPLRRGPPDAMTSERAILFLLGLASTTLGPITGVPGIIIGKRMPERGALGDVGYFLCWLFSIIFGLAFLAGFIAVVILRLWRQ